MCDGANSVNRTNSNNRRLSNETGINNLEETQDKKLSLPSKESSGKTETQETEEMTKTMDDEEEFNEVCIQTIAADSLAAADGRLFQGDILLQV